MKKALYKGDMRCAIVVDNALRMSKIELDAKIAKLKKDKAFLGTFDSPSGMRAEVNEALEICEVVRMHRDVCVKAGVLR